MTQDNSLPRNVYHLFNRMNFRKSTKNCLWRASYAALILLSTTSCAVGPNFVSPSAPQTEKFTADEQPQNTGAVDIKGGEEQTLFSGRDLPAEWWELFQSPALTALVKEGLANNPDLQAAEAALRQAEANYRASRSNLLPSIDGNFSASRENISNKSFGFGSGDAGDTAYNLYNTSVTVSYGLDIFGRARRANEALDALIDYQTYQREAAYLTLTANIVTMALQEASLRGQILATEEIISAERKQLDLLQKQLDFGAVAKSEVLQQVTNVAQSEATLPPLQKQLAQTRHLLSTLTGKMPNEDVGTIFTLDSLQLPQEIPLSLPSQLVAQRPDIKAAEALMKQANAQVGLATANMLPQITLSGSYGSGASQFDDLLTPGSAFWSLGTGILQPLFHGGELLSRRKAAQAGYDQTAAQYRSVVLGAFREVADALRALQLDTDALKAKLAAEQSAKTSLELTRSQYQAGAVSTVNVLTAEQAYEQSRIALVQAQVQRYTNTVALFQALGGGWWNRDKAKTDLTPQSNTEVQGSNAP